MPKEITRMDQLPPGTLERVRAAGSELAGGLRMLPPREKKTPVQLAETDPRVKTPIAAALESAFPIDKNNNDAPIDAPATVTASEPAPQPGPDSDVKETPPKQARPIRRRTSQSGKSKASPKGGAPTKRVIPDGEPSAPESKDATSQVSGDPVSEPGDSESSPVPGIDQKNLNNLPPEPTAPAEEFSAAALAAEFSPKPNQVSASIEDADSSGGPSQRQETFLDDAEETVPGSAEEDAVLKEYGVRATADGRFEERPNETREKLSLLEGELEAARKRYVEVDLEKSSALLRLRNFFGLKQGVSLEDVESVRHTYDEARNSYIQARLAEVERRYDEKKSDAYKKEMADTLNFGEFEGRVRLYEARKQADIERKAGTLAGRITEKVSEYLHAYNRMKWYNKMAIGGALVGVAAAGGSIAVGAAFARGILAGGSMSVILDAALEVNANNKAQKQAEEAGKRIFQKIAELEEQQKINERADGGRDDEERLQSWSAVIQKFSDKHLSAQSEMVTKLFEERRDAMKRRKWIVGASGAASGLVIGKGWIGSGVRYVMDHGTGIGFIDKAFHLAAGTADIHPVSPPTTDVATAATLDSSSGYEHFLKTANVKPGDNFWNLVKERVNDLHLDEGRSRYLIDSIKDKATALTPAQVKELGISSGDISQLRPGGDRIDFTRLFGQKDFDQYLSHAKGLSGGVAKQIAEHKVSAAAAAIDANVSPEIPTPSIDIAPVPVGGGAEAVVSAGAEPVFSPEYVSRVDNWYSQIFRVENPGVGQDWVFDRSEIMKLRVMDVVKDMKAMNMGQWSGYKSGLSPEQYKNFYEFATQMQKSGTLSMTEFLRGNVNGTVGEYLEKAAPRATAGATYGLFSTSG